MSDLKSRLNFTVKEITELTTFVQQNKILHDGTRGKTAEREKLRLILSQNLHKPGS